MKSCKKKNMLAGCAHRICCLCVSPPFCFDDREPLLQLLLVLGPQRVEALELGAAELRLEHQLVSAAHETGCVVPTVDQTQLGFLRVHRFLGDADLVLRRGSGAVRRLSDLKIFFIDEKKNGCKPFLSSARSLYTCCGLIWRIPLQIHSVIFLLWHLPSRHPFLFQRKYALRWRTCWRQYISTILFAKEMSGA